MATLSTDPDREAELIAERRATGADRYDEVWDGVYVMSPLANDEHQALVGELSAILHEVVQRPRLGQVRPGVNVSDRRTQWKRNFRCPDVVVFLNGTQAKCLGTHWYGGPDLAIEIVSPHDRTWEKVPFYENIGTRELLIVDRNPWKLTLLCLQNGRLIEAGQSTPAEGQELRSQVVPLVWQLTNHQGRSAIAVMHHDGQRRWLVETGT